jgi:hypothetical protein
VRRFIVLALLAMPACNVASDATNEQVTLEYDKQKIREGAAKAGQTVRNVASGVGNVAAATGRAIRNEVGEVEVDVKRTRPGENQAQPR